MPVSRKHLGRTLEVLHDFVASGTQPKAIITSTDVAKFLGDEVRTMFADKNGIPPTPSGVHKAIGDLLGGGGLQLKKSGCGYVMPRFLPVVVDDTLVRGAEY
jgi:hypothetical protein